MKAKQHQIDLAVEGLKVIKEYGFVYLGSEERTGKTITSILISEYAKNIELILVVTKKNAVKDWTKTLKSIEHEKIYMVTTYHQLSKVKTNYDLIIFDEAHNYISCFPKRTPIWLEAKRIANLKPIIYMSATPHAQGYHLMFNQFALSSWSPWSNFADFYAWFNTYGAGKKKKVFNRWVNDYTKVKDNIIEPQIKKYFVSRTRKELGFKHEPEDVLHYIELNESTKKAYNFMLKHKVIELKDQTLLLDSSMKLRSSLHMLEGGIAKNTLFSPDFDRTNVIYSWKEKIEDEHIYHVHYNLENREKIDYILETWGDSNNMAIMYNYQGEFHKLKKILKNVSFFQATSAAEGVDLSMFEHLIIYSQNFSTAKHTQRRARQANLNRKTPIKVHYLLVKKGISEEVYETVSVNKENYVDARFKREILL